MCNLSVSTVATPKHIQQPAHNTKSLHISTFTVTILSLEFLTQWQVHFSYKWDCECKIKKVSFNA